MKIQDVSRYSKIDIFIILFLLAAAGLIACQDSRSVTAAESNSNLSENNVPSFVGSISSEVVNPQNRPVAYAISEADIVYSGNIDAATGLFTLSSLPPDIYTVAIQDTAGNGFVWENISVSPGKNIDLGIIALQ